MAFDSLRRIFKFGSRSYEASIEEERKERIDREMDSLERDIQEYLETTESRSDNARSTPPVPDMPERFSQGQAITRKRAEQD